MIKCQTCETENLDSSQFCDECGRELNPFATRIQKLEIPEFQSSVPETPSFKSANVTSVGIPAIMEEINSEDKPADSGNHKSNGVHATLIIERGESVGTEFALSSEESTIGRWDADNGIFPDVDLDAHDAEAKVSRRHARIRRGQGKYMIEDLGSTNGTFVNRGRRLIPGNTHLLNDGDEIIVGKTFLRFYIND